MKTCSNCGEEISDNISKFCPKCGVELETTPANNNNINKFADSAGNALNQVVTQAKIEKNYIKYRLEDTEKTQVKGDEFILSERIANTIDNITHEKQKRVEKTKIKIEDDNDKTMK